MPTYRTLEDDMTTDEPAEIPPHRYSAALANEIEARWQDRWAAEGTFHAPNPSGALDGPTGDGATTEGLVDRAKVYVLDMFPYPSGAGLHVGHPLGFIGTDTHARFLRMTGHNVLHAMGFDAFGLPAEQYAVQTGQHPRTTTERNVETYRAQLRRLGLAHDERRSVATTDVAFYRWTQWIFLQVFNSWFDPEQRRARPIEDLVAELSAGTRPTPDGRPWAELSEVEQREVVDGFRLAYRDEAPVNWCPGLGTVLANEEVTADRRSERGQLPGLHPHPDPVEDADHHLRRPAAGRPGPDGLARVDQDHAAELDRPLDRRDRRLPDRGRTAGGLHHPAGHPVRRDLHGAGARAPAGRRAGPGGVAGGHPRGVDRRARDPGGGAGRVPGAGGRA